VQQQQPLTVYVQLRRLQNRVRESTQQLNAANLLLVAGRGHDPEARLAGLKERLARVATLEDYGLTLRPDHSGERYLSLETSRMLLEPEVVDTVRSVAGAEGWRLVPTMTYLANLITDDSAWLGGSLGAAAGLAGRPNVIESAWLARWASGYTPYSAVTALDPSAAPPWGPFVRFVEDPAPGREPRVEPVAQPLADDEVLVNEFVARDLWPDGRWLERVGRPVVTLTYFVESEGWYLRQARATFRLAGVVPLQGPAADRSLTPEFPGIRGANISDWDPPFPREQWHPGWVRETDERYWRRYRATPKAFVSPGAAARLWASRFGESTSLRIAPPPGRALQGFEAEVREKLQAAFRAEALGLRFQDVKAQGLAASGSSTAESFGYLFVSFSFFLIVSAAMLVALLFKLGIERRAKEVGLLYAAGYRQRTVRRLFLAEGAALAVLGGVLGAAAAVGYARGLLAVLRRAWAGTLATSFLEFHVARTDPALGPVPYPSLVVGFAVSVLIALGVIAWSLRGLRRVAVRRLLAGEAVEEARELRRPAGRARKVLLAIAALVALVLAAASVAVPRQSAAPLFFGSGAVLLLAGLLGLSVWLRRPGEALVGTRGLAGLVRFGATYGRRSPGRSLLTAGLLAAATFLVVAVESFRQRGADEQGRASGTGGFALLAEADVPFYEPPATPESRRALLPDLSAAEAGRLNAGLAGAGVYGLRLRPGDDVSCLNLYQPQQPRVLGVPDRLIERGGFRFAAVDRPSPEEEANPWLVLKRSDSAEVPVIADEHTATWVLQKSLGQTWSVSDESGAPVALKLVGLLQGSIFQSELLISEDAFRRLFPHRAGYAVLLVEAPPGEAAQVKQTLEATFGERYGLTVTRTADRLAAFHAVENTYLSTFQVLGGLGVLLGTLGLAVVLVRNVWERRGELALLRSLGYSRAALRWLVLAENGFLVLAGLAVGLAAALVAVAPHLAGRPGDVPWPGIVALVVLVWLCGLAAGGLALAVTSRTPILPALRRE
jgi:hypothetical protein